MTSLQQPNPLDFTLLAIDEAWRRCGLPGVDIHLHLELRGRVELVRLRRAVAALHTAYPLIAGGHDPARWFGAPRWRLGTAPRPDDAIEVVDIDASESARLHAAERLLASRVDWRGTPPLRVYVLRGTPLADDGVILRWPHGLMDARGGATLLEELIRFDACADAALPAEPNGDERRSDFGALDSPIAGAVDADQPDSRARRSNGVAAQLCPPIAQPGERLRLLVHRLDPGAAQQIRTAAIQTCGMARLADFVRACAVVALHRTLRPAADQPVEYTTQVLVDNRKRRDPGPVCRNVFSTLPVSISSRAADDVGGVADEIQAQTTALLRSDFMHRRVRALRRLQRLPHALLSWLLARSLRSKWAFLPLGLTNSPSLPLGFMGPLSQPAASFFGAEFVNLWGIRPASLRAGYVLNVNAAQDRMNIAASYFEPRVATETMQRLVQTFAALLTSPR